jgi:hypothetical protein
MGDTARPVLIRSMAAMLVTVVLMTAMQRQTRPPPPDSQSPTKGAIADHPLEPLDDR